MSFLQLLSWPPRDWRMLVALILLGIAGAGAWALNCMVLPELVKLSVATADVWPVAYYAYGALAVLAIPTLMFGVVVGLKSFSLTGPGDTSLNIAGDRE